jgi:mono/diheme cytochrome c family protein
MPNPLAAGGRPHLSSASRRVRGLALLILITATAWVHAQSSPAPSRGELLYATHCVECHNTQMHWRASRQARDWPSLQAQVRRWQAAAHLGWSGADINEVTRHLNDTIYHFAQPPSASTAVGAR